MLCGRERMEGFLLRKLADESQRRPDIIRGDIVLALDFFECHATCEAADHDRDRHARAPYHGLSMVDRWVNYDTVLSCHIATR
jgi:hypothetical protein